MSSYSLFASGAAPLLHRSPSSHGLGSMAPPHLSSSSLAAALDDPLWSTPRLGDGYPSSPVMYRAPAPPTLTMSYGPALQASVPSPTSSGSSTSSDGSYEPVYDSYTADTHEYEAYHTSAHSGHGYGHPDYVFASPPAGYTHDGVFASTWSDGSPSSPSKRMAEYTYLRSTGSFSYTSSLPNIARRSSQISLATASPTRPQIKLESPTLCALPLGMSPTDYDALSSWNGYTREDDMLYYAYPFVEQQPVYTEPQPEERVCDPRSAFVSPAAQDQVPEGAVAQASSPHTSEVDDGLGDADAEGEQDNDDLTALLPSPVLTRQIHVPAPPVHEPDADEVMSEASEGDDDVYVFEEDDGSEYDDTADGDYGKRTSRKRRAPVRSRASTRRASSPLEPLRYPSPEAGTIDEEFYAPVGQHARRTRGGNITPSVMPLPVPVPNLTKKSRGRRVPTTSSLVVKGGVAKTERAYTCRIDGCGKCFARGEHLKRHVRSIHTNEKPHACPYPGCNKAFSRHDNLGQHMRVHKDYSSKRCD